MTHADRDDMAALAEALLPLLAYAETFRVRETDSEGGDDEQDSEQPQREGC